MKTSLHKALFLSLATGAALWLASCNKDVAGPVPIVTAVPTGRTITDTVNNAADLTILKAAVARAATFTGGVPSVAALLADRTGEYTLFAPTDQAFQTAFAVLGIPPTVGINFFRPGQLDTILRYHIVGGRRLSTADTNAFRLRFPNTQLPSQLVLAPPSASLPPGLRSSVFAGKRDGFAFVNSVPVTGADIAMGNGIVHKIGLPLLPPSQMIWDRINTDPNLTYLKAAVQRADSGVVAANTMQAALSNPAANFTVFAPTDVAFRQLLIAQITQALVARGFDLATAQATATALSATPAVFTNPLLATVLTPTTVQGLVAYHLLGEVVPGSAPTRVNGVRAFTVNIPSAPTNSKTFLNVGIAVHPGVTVQSTIGATGVTAASVKGLANATASNVVINPLPAPGGTSDQHYINGVLHVIDQVLRPQ